MFFFTYLKNGTILQANFSAERKPCENSITSAISCRSGVVMANDLNNFFKLSGRLERPAYPGFIVINIAMSGETRTCFPTNSTVIPKNLSLTLHLKPQTSTFTYFHWLFPLAQLPSETLTPPVWSAPVAIRQTTFFLPNGWIHRNSPTRPLGTDQRKCDPSLGSRTFRRSWRPRQIYPADCPELSQIRSYRYQRDLQDANCILQNFRRQ